LTEILLPVIAVFNPKIRLFVNGRKQTFDKLQKAIQPTDKTVWIHCASLGEFEQGRPIIEKIKAVYPHYKVIVSFFSPSGYEIQKNYALADAVVYLPLDTTTKAKRFVALAHPTLAIFVKYEFWPNLLAVLRHKNIKTILVSGIFRKEQYFFKKNKRWFKNSLQTFTRFFVQNEDSVTLLKSIGFSNVTENGDTRFDRVLEILKNKKELPLLNQFTKGHHILVAGSTWAKDESLLVKYINSNARDDEKFIFAPHNIKPDDIEQLKKSLTKKTLLYSQANAQNINNVQVLIIDSIGILTQVYAYADVAYVGGGFGVGIHNILEPATYGVPILIGPNYQKFQEANDLILHKGCFEIDNDQQLKKLLQKLKTNTEFRTNSGQIAFDYIKKNSGATKKIVEYVTKVL
jgi:3-deoxy-D-manno-octulosonic-acid transferase